MYVTRPLSLLLRSPEHVSAPPEGPNSGYLVIQDEESEAYSCFGCCKNGTLEDLPFPQNKELVVNGQNSSGSLDPLILIPVLGQPLSCSRYYAIDPHGKHIGDAFTCSTEEDKATRCFCRCVKDVKPRPLDPHNIYHQFEIVPDQGLCCTRGAYFAKSIAPDGFPPYFLRQKGWSIYTKTVDYLKLGTAQGLDSKLRARLPEFDIPVSRRSSEPVVVGKWYSPFIFVKEGTLRDQVKRSMYYEVTLEQRWEQVFTCYKSSGNAVVIDASLETEEVFIGGRKAVCNEKNAVDGVFLFKAVGYEEMNVGLRVEMVQRMKWEQERAGWAPGDERRVTIDKVEEFKEAGGWSEFGCYVLVERFNLKRMDGSLVISHDFKHCHQMKTKWE